MSQRINRMEAVEIGIYEEAGKANMSLSSYLDKLAEEGNISDELFNPEARHAGNGAPVSAFKQLLRHAGIELDRKGYSIQNGDVFITNPANRVLFPEFISMTYKDAAEDLTSNELRLSDIVAQTIPTNTPDGTTSVDFKYGEMQLDGVRDVDLEFGIIGEGAELPKYLIREVDVTVRARKFGGALQYSYERLKRARLSTVQAHVAKIARAQELRKIKSALTVALNGDGNSNPALNTTVAPVAFVLGDFVGMRITGARNGCAPSIIIGDNVEIQAFVSLPAFLAQDTTADTNNVRGSGQFPTIYGFAPKLAPIGSVLDGSKRLMGFDDNIGLIQFYDPSMTISEQMNYITNQTQILTMTEVVGWAKPDRFCALTLTHA